MHDKIDKIEKIDKIDVFQNIALNKAMQYATHVDNKFCRGILFSTF